MPLAKSNSKEDKGYNNGDKQCTHENRTKHYYPRPVRTIRPRNS